jgi:Choline/Carnitine o-acyltransferase
MTQGHPVPPQHPYMPFAQLLRSFADKHIRSAPMRWLFLKATLFWRKAFGIDAAEKRIKQELDAGLNGYEHEDWPAKAMHYSEILATLVLPEDRERDPVRKAAQVAFSALQFRQRLAQGEFPVEFEAGKPLDMRRYHYLFSRMTLSSRTNGKMIHKIVDFPSSDYFVVAVDGVFYQVQAWLDQEAPSYESLLSELSAVVNDATKYLDDIEGDRAPIGLLTAISSAKSNAVFQVLQSQNKELLDRLEGAIFLLAIDLHDHPRSMERLLRTIQADNYHNRDHRRSMQIVVTGNGRVGVIIAPHAGIGGTIAARFCLELREGCRRLAAAGGETTLHRESRPHRLDFLFRDQYRWRDRLDRLDTEVKQRIYAKHLRSTFRIDGVGTAAFQKRGLSPDGVVHCALHLAYERCFGTRPEVGNFINLRNVQYGDIWRYLSSTQAMRHFLENPRQETLIEAITVHRSLVKEQKQARDEFYLAFMSLKSLVCRHEVSLISAIALILIGSCFRRNFIRTFLDPHLWVSNIPANGGVEITGRGSVHLDYLGRDCMAGHYMIFDDHITVCFLSSLAKKSRYFSEARFVRCLKDCLNELIQMCASQPDSSVESKARAGSPRAWPMSA